MQLPLYELESCLSWQQVFNAFVQAKDNPNETLN